MDARELHTKLWTLIESEGIEIHPVEPQHPDTGELGSYHPEGRRRRVKTPAEAGRYRLPARAPDSKGLMKRRMGPVIEVRRKQKGVPDDNAQELITLAHEYGHHQSHAKGERPLKEMPWPKNDLTEAEKVMIEQEEARAWRYGRAVLEHLDPAHDFSVYEKRKVQADEAYAKHPGEDLSWDEFVI